MIPSDFDPGQCVLLTRKGRPCAREATLLFGRLPMCWMHHDEVRGTVVEELADADSDLYNVVRQTEAWKTRSAAERDMALRIAERDRVERDRQRRSRVYFAERDGWVKIGRTVDIEKRMAQLALGGTLAPEGMTRGPLNLLLVIAGGSVLEGQLHREFAADRVAGEWFRRSPAIDVFLAERSAVAA